MRKQISVKLPIFIKALENLGYRKCGEKMQWRREKFHIILGKSKRHLNVRLHVDYFDPVKVHRSRYSGKDIVEEFKRIKNEIQKATP